MKKLTVGIAVLMFMPLAAPAQEAAKPGLNIVIVEGEGVINNVRQRVTREVIIQVEDENHKPVAGAMVSLLLPERGAGAYFQNGQTSLIMRSDQAGRVVVQGMKANSVTGKYQIRITASHEGRSATAVVGQSNVTAAAAAAGGMSMGKVLAIIAVAAGAAVGGGIAASGGKESTTSVPTITTQPATVIRPGTPTVAPPR